MATILEFRVTDTGGHKEAPPERTLGEIIIFPGVRIERHDARKLMEPRRDGEPSAEARTKSRA